ncbi:hypothetical protein PSEG_02807 [Pseudomonas sp. Nvir]|nr:hypothetical protein PSNVIR_04516 [Pseudomonas sp. Nvir]
MPAIGCAAAPLGITHTEVNYPLAVVHSFPARYKPITIAMNSYSRFRVGNKMSGSVTETTHHQHLHRLYQDHNGWLRGWLRQRLSNSADAADLAQDTFVRVMVARTAHSLQQPRHYLATIARGLVIDLYRRRSLEQAYLQALASRPDVHAPCAETRAIILESLLAIDRMLDGLGLRTRQIFLAVQLDGLTYEKTAERFNVSVSTVRKHLAKGLMHCLLMDGE